MRPSASGSVKGQSGRGRRRRGSRRWWRDNRLHMSRRPPEFESPFFQRLDDIRHRCPPVVVGDHDHAVPGDDEIDHPRGISQDGPHPGPVSSRVAARYLELHRPVRRRRRRRHRAQPQQRRRQCEGLNPGMIDHVFLPLSPHRSLPTGGGNLDGIVKSPDASLRFIPRHCDVRTSTPHSSGCARLACGSFYDAVPNGTFCDLLRCR